MFRMLTFRSRLIAALIILSVPPFAALGVLAIVISREELKRSMAAGVTGAAARYVAFADSWVRERQNDLRMLPDEWDPSTQNRKHIIPWLIKIRTAKPAYRSLLVANRSGKVIFAIQSDAVLSDVSRERFFRTAASGKSYISGVELDKQTRAPRMILAAPLPKGLEIAGVLAAEVDLSELQRELRGLNLGNTGGASIVNDSGQIVASSMRAGKMESLDLPRLLSMRQGRLHEYRDADGKPVMAAQRRVPMLRATLVVRQDASETFAAVRRLTWLLVLGLCAGLVAVSGIGALLASHFCRPLADLRQTALDLGEGTLSERVPERGPEEIRALAQAFNGMLDRLQHSRESLERRNIELADLTSQLDILHRIDSRLLSAVRVKDVLATAVNSATEVGCPRSAMFMVDSERQEIRSATVQSIALPSGDEATAQIPDVWIGTHDSGQTAAPKHRFPKHPKSSTGDRWLLLPILTPAAARGRGCERGRCRLERRSLPRAHELWTPPVSDGELTKLLADAAGSMLCKACLECGFREVRGVLAAEARKDREFSLISLARQSALAVAHASNFEEASSEKDQLLAQLLRAQEDERQRVAMDLHDGPTQRLSAAALALETCRELLRKQPRVALDGIEAIERVMRQAVDEMRELVHDLRPPALDDMGLATAIAQQVREVAAAANLKSHITVRGKDAHLDQQRAAVVFRVAQEALANVRKHAQARNLWVRMQTADAVFRLDIRDDGRGFVVEDDGSFSPRHFGLMGMRERAGMIGSHLGVSSVPGAGTTVTLEVPLAGKEVASDAKDQNTRSRRSNPPS